MSPEPGDLDFTQGRTTPEDAIIFFEDTDPDADIEGRVDDTIRSIEEAGQSEVSECVAAAKYLQASVAAHLSELEKAAKTDVPVDILSKARKLAERLHESIRTHTN